MPIPAFAPADRLELGPEAVIGEEVEFVEAGWEAAVAAGDAVDVADDVLQDQEK
ncbi:hypothetical protein LTR08_001968 [Meristemomyces frigidus]|nr:hypothetical protein LTR08_001968 [Meristemomyces frigidus]